MNTLPGRVRCAMFTGMVCATAAANLQAQGTTIATSITARVAGLVKHDGFLPIYVDERQGRILIELPRDSTRTLFMITQATGLGSNPIGIDRGSSGDTYVARFDRDGDHVLFVLENWSYRVTSDNADHARTVAEAFPPSTIAALPLLATEGGRLLVDATDIAMRGGHIGAESTGQLHRRARSVEHLPAVHEGISGQH
jgi:hypothetical protein